MTEKTVFTDPPHGIPELNAPSVQIMRRALSLGWTDFRAAPAFGLMAAATCILAGYGMVGITQWSGHTVCLGLAVFGFPMAARFAAFGTYEVSRPFATRRACRVGASACPSSRANT